MGKMAERERKNVRIRRSEKEKRNRVAALARWLQQVSNSTFRAPKSNAEKEEEGAGGESKFGIAFAGRIIQLTGL
jgi:hypothetical protein